MGEGTMTYMHWKNSIEPFAALFNQLPVQEYPMRGRFQRGSEIGSETYVPSARRSLLVVVRKPKSLFLVVISMLKAFLVTFDLLQMSVDIGKVHLPRNEGPPFCDRRDRLCTFLETTILFCQLR